MSGTVPSKTLPPHLRLADALDRVTRLLTAKLSTKTQPASDYSGEVIISLHIQAGILNHIYEREEDAYSIKATDRSITPRSDESWERLHQAILYDVLTRFRIRLEPSFAADFHGEISLHLPITLGECQPSRCSVRRVYRIVTER